MIIIFSKHALEQLDLRRIPLEAVKDVLQNPQQLIKDEETIYQSITNFEGKEYLVRVFVNTFVEPNRVITVYRTSKIQKYYEG